jgi:hypothetical protein
VTTLAHELARTAGRLRLPALPHVAATTVRRVLVGASLAVGLALVTGRLGWGLVLGGVLLGWPRLL